MLKTVRILLIIMLLSSATAAAQTGDTPQMVGETPSRWFVELSNAPLADVDGNFSVQQRSDYRQMLRAEKDAFRLAARAAGVQFTERYAFDVLWNGLAIEINSAQLGRLRNVGGVKALYPVLAASLPELQPAEKPELATALAMTGADAAQSELGLTGSGVRVAVMDSGIDYNHPDLGGCFGPTCRVIAGWDFVGDSFNFSDPSAPINPIPQSDPDPDDCAGHGTHVAGIIGANGSATGVAPGVTFGAYRVFGCRGDTSADIMLAAMEHILADGADVLNISIGTAFQWPQYPTAQASDRLVNKGIVVVASFGNSGASGLYSGSAPGVGNKVIGVASVDNTYVVLSLFTLSADGASVGFQPATGVPPPPTSGTLPMARTGTSSSAADACLPLTAGSLAGKAVLIRRGGCTFTVKSQNAQSAGAAAIVFYNNASGRFAASIMETTPPVTIPIVSISDTEGALINSRLAAGPVTMTWTATEDTFVNPTAGLVSSSTSYGLAPDLSLKPDLSAPGGLIRSTWLVEHGLYATMSGASMAAAHVTGGVALLLEARPRTPSQAVRGILQNTAVPGLWWGNPTLGSLDNVHRQGAGILKIDNAVLSQTMIEPSRLALGESEGGPAVRTLTIRNESDFPVTYTLSHVPALSTGFNTFSPTFTSGFAAVTFGENPVGVPPHTSATVDVMITANPVLPDRSQYGGYILFTPNICPLSLNACTYRVPYAGFKGDYQSIKAIVPTPSGFPWLAKLVGSTFTKQEDGAVYSLAGGNVPWILLHLDHQVRRLRAEVFDASTGRAWHRAFDLQYVGRNSMATSFFAFSWDGITTAGRRTHTVPNGSYRIVLSVQKALGEDDNPANWESWTSPVFVINR